MRRDNWKLLVKKASFSSLQQASVGCPVLGCLLAGFGAGSRMSKVLVMEWSLDHSVDSTGCLPDFG
jgi:hypothetical protein